MRDERKKQARSMYMLLASFFLPSHLSFKNMYVYTEVVRKIKDPPLIPASLADYRVHLSQPPFSGPT